MLLARLGKLTRLELELDYASKLDRSPAFIKLLMDEGRDKGAEFIAQRNKESA